MQALSLAFAVLALAGCTSTRDITLYEVSRPGRSEPPRPEASVEVHRNAPPRRAVVTRYVIDVSSLVPSGERLTKHLEIAARFGCDGLVVYTDDHPVLEAGPRNDDEVMVLTLDGAVTSRAMGATVPNRRAIWLDGLKGPSIIVASQEPGETVSLCLSYVAP